MGNLPATGTSLYSLLLLAAEDEIKFEKTLNVNNVNPVKNINTLIRILEKISLDDYQKLYEGVTRTSKYYRYYKYNESLTYIPSSQHKIPDGGAIDTLSNILSMKRKEGIISTNEKCQKERNRAKPKHKYIGKYPCEKRRKLSNISDEELYNDCIEENSNINLLFNFNCKVKC
jgi:hypothetical protein